MNTLSLFAQDDNSPLKRCPHCPEGQQWHPATLEFFRRDNQRKSGLDNYCKVCRSNEYFSKPQVQRQHILVQEANGREIARAEAYCNRASSEDLAYLAGIVDGEGCFDIHFDRRCNSYYPRIRVEMTHYETIAWMQALFPGLKLKPTIRKNRNHSTTYRWGVQGPKALTITRAILPYLKGKRKEAELFLTFPYTGKRSGYGYTLPQEIIAERKRLYLMLREQKTKGKGLIKYDK